MKIVYKIILILFGIFGIFLGILLYNETQAVIKNNKIKASLNTYVSLGQANDLWLMARVVNAEVSGCSIYDKLAVPSSILNRLDDGNYGGSIHDVIYKKNQYAISDTFTQMDLHIAYSVYVLGLRDCEVKYFFNPNTARSKQMKQITSKNSLKFKTRCHEYY